MTSQSRTKWKIKLSFYFHTSLWCFKRFYEGLKGFHKTFWGTTKKCENKNLTKFLFRYSFQKWTDLYRLNTALLFIYYHYYFLSNWRQSGMHTLFGSFSRNWNDFILASVQKPWIYDFILELAKMPDLFKYVWPFVPTRHQWVKNKKN